MIDIRKGGLVFFNRVLSIMPGRLMLTATAYVHSPQAVGVLEHLDSDSAPYNVEEFCVHLPALT